VNTGFPSEGCRTHLTKEPEMNTQKRGIPGKFPLKIFFKSQKQQVITRKKQKPDKNHVHENGQ
jgi:hypothetical protein